jgi:hypothetical protein
MPKEFLDDIEEGFKDELAWADKDCFRRRVWIMDILKRIESEKKLRGLR